ncbi:MAG: DUF1501 domain-containing protein [Bdellovibrionales bacterium]|nr:DUF1501 domain-containing protein [Bdellovibrionales bacterium]
MKFPPFEHMAPNDRRNFLKALGTVLALPFTPKAVQEGIAEILFGPLCYAQAFPENQATYFVEINLRDQFDIGHAIVPPGIATHPGLKRGSLDNQVVLYDNPSSLLSAGNRFFLTTEGRPLQPYLDNIAVIDTCELGIGVIHGHEASSALRSPGRSFTAGANRSPMFNLDPADGDGGNQQHYSATPTPAVLHNYYQKQLNSQIKNAVAYKGVRRPDHTIYHHSANLANAQPDRYQSTATFLAAFSGLTNTTDTILSKHGTTIASLLKKVDENFLASLKYGESAKINHGQQITGLGVDLKNRTNVTPINIALSPEEISFWSTGITDIPRASYGPKAPLWEQTAYATKLIQNNVVKTIALEYCYIDVHDDRNETILRSQATQFAFPLARMIQQLKAAGKFDQTVIAIYTTDGSRSPASESYGTNSKNSVILAGGRIRGGYYGDVKVAGDLGNGHQFSYHKPNEANGVALAAGDTAGGGRTSGASVWKTVAKALGISSSLYNSYTDVQSAPSLDFLLRT